MICHDFSLFLDIANHWQGCKRHHKASQGKITVSWWTLSTPFDAQMNTYEETKLWSEIKANITIWLDGIYSWVYNYRIRTRFDFSRLNYCTFNHSTYFFDRGEITIHYNHGCCQIDLVLTSNANTTLKDVWRKAIEQPGVLVLIKHQKTNILELDIHVGYPPRLPKQSDNEGSDFSDFGQVLTKLKICNLSLQTID